MSYFLMAYLRYVEFKGRSSRSEYWYFNLFFFIGIIAFGFLDIFLGLYQTEQKMGLLGALFILLSIIPSIALSIRRLHDIGQSGWLFLLLFIPIIGIIALIYFGITDSEVGNNQYGANPKL